MTEMSTGRALMVLFLILLMLMVPIAMMLITRYFRRNQARRGLKISQEVLEVMDAPTLAETEARPPGDKAIAELVSDHADVVQLEAGPAIANIEMPPLVAIHRPEETNRRLEALLEANRQRSEDAREKAKNSRLDFIASAGASSEDTIAAQWGYANGKAMHRAWKRHGV